jgi:Xaa-Pro dipeptidase
LKPIEKIKEYLVKNNFDAVLLRQRNSFSWLTEGKKNHIVLSDPNGVSDWLIFQDKNYLITNKMEERRVVEEECSNLSFPFEVRSVEWTESTDSLIEELTHEKRVVSDVNYQHFVNKEEELVLVRSVLSEDEISRYRTLCQDAAAIIERTCREIEPGMTELEIASVINKKAVANDIIVQVALVATDERIYKYRHPIPTKKQLDQHAMLVLCGERGGLVANVTRLVYFGELPADIRENKQKLARIDVSMNAATRPGAVAGEVIQRGIEQYEQAGFPDDWKLLHQGGLTGYNSREFLATPTSENVILENQAYAWNPALPGVKSEDTILVERDGIEFLTQTGDWEYITVEMGGRIYQRPDILIRKKIG